MIISRNATNKYDFMFLNIFILPFQVKKVYFWGGMAAWSGERLVVSDEWLAVSDGNHIFADEETVCV